MATGTMSAHTGVFVFGDQIYDVSDLIAKLSNDRGNVLLADFLEKSISTIKGEIRRLHPWQQACCPRFTKLAELVPYWRSSTLNPALSQALTTTVQLGSTLCDFGKSTKSPYPTAKDSILTGICTGSLSAATVSCTSGVAELSWLGVHTVAVAFRVGACAWDVASRLTVGGAEDRAFASWTAAVHGVEEGDMARAIAQFVEKKGIAPSSSPYISANIGPAQVSISGPYDTLKSFLTDGLPGGGKVFARLPIPAPYHAPIHYDDEDVASTVDWLRDTRVEWPSSDIPMVSSRDGQLVPSGDFVDVLRTAVEDCLISKIRLDLVPQAVVAQLRDRALDSYYVYSVAAASDRLRQAIESSMKAQPVEQLKRLEDVPSAVTHGGTGPPSVSRAKIAVVGMSGRFPHASSMDAFWDVLKRGEDTHELVPAIRWDATTHVELSPSKNTSGTGFGCWLHDAGLFDARFFNMSPREAPQVDPAQRLALLTAAEALEQAGIVPGATQSTQKDRVGVYFGSTSNDWMETNSAQNVDTYFIPGGNRAFIPGRINYHFKFSGPSYTIDTACSSSLAAIHMACNALWRGEVDTAIVGGTNVLTNPDMHAGLDRGHFLSRTGNCKTFDESADGYCRGEAVATAILKRLDDAQSDGDRIQACILGIATNHSAEAASITRPHVGAQQQLFQSLLTDVGVSPAEISYVEMHGTGTQAGDAGETESVLDTVAPLSGSGARKSSEPLFIGAAKSNFGHGEAAAGITSLAKVVSMFKHSTIPPHNGIKTKINSKIPDLAPRNAYIAKSPVSWPRPSGSLRRVLLNNFSAAGGNTAMVLEDASEPATLKPLEKDPRSHHLITVSAKTPASLQANLRSLVEWLAQRGRSDSSLLPRLAYTTTARRSHHPHRVTAIGSSLEAVQQSLQASLTENEGSIRSASVPGVIFAFTGQGSHFPGMAAELFEHVSSFKADIMQYDRLCKKLGFPRIAPLFQDASNYDNANSTVLQLASVALQMALYRWWTSLGVQLKAVVGHSLGEYAALYAASVLSQADVLYLVGKRAQLMEQHCTPNTHAMLAVRATIDVIIATLGPAGTTYEVCCLNGQTSVVLGGTKAKVKTAQEALTAAGMKSTFLDVPWAWHSSQVDPLLPSLDKLAHGVHFSVPRLNIISPACGGIVPEGSAIDASFVARHCRATVSTHQALLQGLQSGLIDDKMLGIEIGPAPVVCKMVRDVLGTRFDSFPTICRETDTWALVNAALSRLYIRGYDILWRVLHSDFPGCQHMLELPAYGWDLKEYWLKYTNDWSLRKGEAPLQRPLSIESSSIHTVLSDTMNISGGTIVAEADLSRKDLNPMVQGHKVYGVPLCTPSVYADIALTFGNRLKSVLDAGKHKLVEVSEMTIQSALVANSEGKAQKLRMEATMSEKHEALCTFSSVDEQGKILEQHAHCTIRLFDAAARQQTLQQTAETIQKQIAAVCGRAKMPGNTFRFSRNMIYKMVGQLADFDPNYRGLVEITLDNDQLEAFGRVSFADVVKDGKFHTHPAYIDALSQLGGFVMNANEGTDLEKEVFVNHGWYSLQLYEDIQPECTYTTHVKMREGSDKLWTGDITILCEGRVVGVFTGVALQGVPKRLMHFIVTAANKRIGGASAAVETKPKRPAVTSAQTMPTVPVSRPVATTTSSIKTMEKQAVEILSQESGVAITDLTDDSRFDDFGVDSLLTLVVSSRMRDELALEFQSSLLAELETVGALKAHIRTLNVPSAAVDFGAQKRTSSTPAAIEPTTAGGVSNSSPVFDERCASLWEPTLEILAAESGLADVDLTDDTAFCDIGIDSLLSLVICSRMRDELGVDISERAFCTDLPTVGALKKHVIGKKAQENEPSDSDDGELSLTSSSVSDATSQSNTPPSELPTPMSTPMSEANELAPTIDAVVRRGLERNDSLFHSSMDPKAPAVKPAWSITLQGSAKRSSRRLFLFPDGCGAATSYLRLPNLDNDTAVIGFNCPFMKTPAAMRGRQLHEILEAYLQALRKHQPHGPYHLGGWSAGGILAFAAAQELMAAGEDVATLLLIDSPDPSHGLDRLPQRFFDHCAKVGIFGSEMTETKTVPPWLVPHFEATIDLLYGYRPLPISRSAKMPHVNIIWAGECALDGVRYAKLPKEQADDRDTEGMKFLTERRQDFGPGGWANLFPGADIKVEVAEGEHHFSLMRNDGAERLAGFIRKAMAAAA